MRAHFVQTRGRMRGRSYALALVVVGGCAIDTVPNSDLELNFTGNYDGSVLHAKVVFSRFSGQPFDGDPADSLTVSIGGVDAPVIPDPNALSLPASYAVDVPIANAIGLDATLEVYHRGDITHSTLTIPPAFTVDPAPPTVSRADGFTVTWRPAASNEIMWWSASGECISSANNLPGAMDPGTFDIPHFEQNFAEPDLEMCTATLQVLRRQDASVDPAYHDGTARGVLVNSVTFTSTP